MCAHNCRLCELESVQTDNFMKSSVLFDDRDFQNNRCEFKANVHNQSLPCGDETAAVASRYFYRLCNETCRRMKIKKKFQFAVSNKF